MASRWLVMTCVLVACDEPKTRDVEIWSEVLFPEVAPGQPARRLEAAAAALGTELVIAGGYSTSLTEGLAITDEVLVLDTLTLEWRTLPAMPVALNHAQLAAHGGKLYLLGGHEDVNATANGRAFILDATAPEWREVGGLPTPRGGAGVLVSPPLIYLFGGVTGNTVLSDVIAFDLIDERWIENALPTLPTPRSHAAVMERYDGTLVVTGGIGLPGQGALGDAYRLEPADPTVWKTAEPMSASRGGCAYGTAFGSLVCAGGEAGTSALDLVERYDPTRNVWTTLPAMPEPRAGAQGAMIGGKLYVAGGSTSLMFEPTDSVLVFSFVDTIDNPEL